MSVLLFNCLFLLSQILGYLSSRYILARSLTGRGSMCLRTTRYVQEMDRNSHSEVFEGECRAGGNESGAFEPYVYLVFVSSLLFELTPCI